MINQKKHTWRYRFVRDLKRDWQLHLLILFPLIYILIFSYWPMYGAQIAFRDFSPRKGILESDWVGLKWFVKFLTNYNFRQVFTNTLALSVGSILLSFPLPIIFALLLNTVENEKFKKFVQNVTYIPHFLSIMVLVSIMRQIFSPVSGIYGTVYRLLGGAGYATDFFGLPGAFRATYIFSGIWQQLGWNTIIYMAALSSVSPEYHEAAIMDGASRWKRILYVDFPSIAPTVATMLILRCGSVMSVGFEKAYLMQTSLNLSKSEIISTYVYKVALGTGTDFSYASAIGLFNSIINCVLLVFVNQLTKKMTSGEMNMF